MAVVSMMNFPVGNMVHSDVQYYGTDRPQMLHPLAYSPGSTAPSPRSQQYHPPRTTSILSSNAPVFEPGSKPLLPSISNLLDIANSERPDKDGHLSSTSPPGSRGRSVSEASVHIGDAASKRQQREHTGQITSHPQQSHPAHHAISSTSSTIRSVTGSPRDSTSHKTPTPSLTNDSTLESSRSPSTIFAGSSIPTTQPYMYPPTSNYLDITSRPTDNRQSLKRKSIASQPSPPPFKAPRLYTTSPYETTPPATTLDSRSPTERRRTLPALPTQAPPPPPPPPPQLPSTFPAPPPPPSDTRLLPHLANPWEHHHYISNSSTHAAFTASQDRYICPTCNKAFSRPSSLKIHSHSHTGEKPFKCSHVGCTKAFSVRSNMKRHERGCHRSPRGFVPSSRIVCDDVV